MTAYNVLSSKLVLFDNWPGPISYTLPPADASGNVFTNATHHNVAAAAYQPGTKIGYFDHTSNGISILVYLQFKADTHSTALALGHPCGLEATPTNWFTVTNAGDEAVANSPPAVALGVMTTLYYGWFWGGGVCPLDKTPLLATTNSSTKDGVAAGAAIAFMDVDDPDRAGFDAVANTDQACGFSLAADA